MEQRLKNPVEVPSDAREAREALGQIMERDARARIAAPVRTRRQVFSVIAVVLGVIAAYLWFGNPPFLREPEMAPSEEYQDASLRWVVYLVSQRIEDYRRTHQRLPDGLADAGGGPQGIDYVRLDASHYRVMGSDGAQTVTFYSGTDPAAFLGSSLTRLRAGRRATS
ncbi:MAG: hypothetical protein HYR73_05430 [Candidatus Eisenbacteria bacterium]|nr:hypothetical protein [Candidatus Eisenbacteria bacterium]